MKDKVCLITGGNSGIGKAAAIQLAEQGLNVIIGCRNAERANKALQDIKVKSKNKQVDILLIDMSSQASIRKAVGEFKAKYGVLDILIHNAADFDISRKLPQYSEDNIETVWATNHIGPVLLTELLLDDLGKSNQGRIITISSQGLIMHPMLKVDLKDPEFREKKYSVEKAYYQSKLAQVIYTYGLSNQLRKTNITVNCIRVTNVKIDIGRYPDLSPFMKGMYSIKSKFSISPETMAETYTYLATSPDLSKVTGKYFNEKKETVSSSTYSQDENHILDVMTLTRTYL